MNDTTLSTKYLIFRVEKQIFAVLLDDIVEVIEPMNTSPIPDSPGHCIGMMNLRGDIMTVYDLRSILGHPQTTTPNMFKLVVERAGERCAFLVDEMVEVTSFNKEEIDTETLINSRLPKESFIGIANHRDSIVYIIELKELINFTRRAV